MDGAQRHGTPGFSLQRALDVGAVGVFMQRLNGEQYEFFERADLMDTKVGVGSKDDPAVVAKDGFEAMQAGKADVVSGWKNKLQTTVANIMPNEMLAEQHRKMAEPGSAKKASAPSESRRTESINAA